jgi:2-oxoglutarate ferredoxin oxidoreductase subunit alpha
MYYISEFNKYIKKKFDEIEANEERWESVNTDDAELIIVAYGISSRVSRETVLLGRAEGLKLGLIRPISLWPFPKKAFAGLSSELKGFLTVEMSALGQICEDVALASRMTRPVYADLPGDKVPESDRLLELAKDILAGKVKEVL